jgi:hypothetical protein
MISAALLFMLTNDYCRVILLFVIYTIYYVWKDKTSIENNGVINV